MNDLDALMAHVRSLPPARRRQLRRRYADLRPAIDVLHGQGYNAREITEEVRKFPTWAEAPWRRVYDAVCYYIRAHVKPTKHS